MVVTGRESSGACPSSIKALTRTTSAEQKKGSNSQARNEKKPRHFSRHTTEDGEEFFVPEDEDGGDSVWYLPDGAVLINTELE